MTPEQLLYKIVAILKHLKIPYVVTGGFAVAVWGKPRFTADIDIIVELPMLKIRALAKSLLAIDKDVYVDELAMGTALKGKREFNFIHPQTGLKVDFWIMKGDEFSRMELKRAVIKKIDGQHIYFISPEDLILSKLLWYKASKSTRHLEDIESILKISKVDLKYIKQSAVRQSTTKILEDLLNKR